MNVTATPVRLICGGCGWLPAPSELVFRCRFSTDDDPRDHVLITRLDLAASAWPTAGDVNPFVRYRSLNGTFATVLTGRS